MHNEFTAIFERDGEWHIGYCPEVPGANGQGRTIKECRQSLTDAIALILEDRREDGLKGVPPGALQEVLTVEWSGRRFLSTSGVTDAISSEKEDRTRFG